MSTEGNNSEHVTTREFQNFREDMKQEFHEVHECNKRVEDKLDDFIGKAGPIFNEYQQQKKAKETVEKKNWDLKKALIASLLGIVGSVVTTGIIVLIGFGR